MNKTVTVNLGGIVFHIDDNAYEILKRYLEKIRNHFSASDGRDEIMQDIESRLAEMFSERIKDNRQVIVSTDVEEVTKQMGKPEEIIDDSGGESNRQSSSSSSSAQETYVPVSKRFFRNPDDKSVGGVCSGLAAYFGWDVAIVRVIFFAAVIFSLSFAFWLYIILWIAIPEAKTSAEKLQMKGEPVTVSNIEKNVKEEMDNLKSRMEAGKTRAGSGLSNFFEALGDVLKVIVKVLGKIIAAAIVFFAVAILIAFIAGLFGMGTQAGVHIMGLGLKDAYLPVINSDQYIWWLLGILLAVILPLMMLAYWGIKVLFNIKFKSIALNLTVFGLWIIGVIICTVNGVRLAKEFAVPRTITKEITLQQPAQTLRLDINGLDPNYDANDYDEFTFGWSETRKHFANLEIQPTSGTNFELVKVMTSRGRNADEAQINAGKIIYTITQKDSTLILDPMYSLPENTKYRGQRLKLILKIPEGKRVYFGKHLNDMFYDLDNVQNILDRDMVNRTWQMTAKGLSCLDCTGSEEKVFKNDEDWNVDDNAKVNIDKNGLEVNSENTRVKIDENGVHISSDGKNIVKIDSTGLNIKNR